MAPDTLVTLISASASVVVGIVSGALSSYITFRLQFVAFQSMDREREKHWVQWRDLITHDVEALKGSASITSIALLAQDMIEIKRRLTSIEAKLEK